MKFFKNLISFIIYILIIIIISLTVYFCIDAFGIIEIPKEYSVLAYVSQKIDEYTVKDAIEIKELEYYYYNQLSDYGKIIYYGLFKNKDKLKSGKFIIDYGNSFEVLLSSQNGNEILNNEFQLAVNAFSFDNPEVFYIDISKMSLITEITTGFLYRKVNVSIGPNNDNYLYDDFLDENSLNLGIQRIENIKKDFLNRNYNDDIERLRDIHDYLVDNVQYEDNGQLIGHNIYGSLVKGQSVCEGYAKAYKYILDDMNIPCIVVCGTGNNSENEIESHAWNYVYIKDKWYAVDVTWDDPTIKGDGVVSETRKYKYFMVGSNTLFQDHVEDGKIISGANIKYPQISVEDY